MAEPDPPFGKHRADTAAAAGVAATGASLLGIVPALEPTTVVAGLVLQRYWQLGEKLGVTRALH
jgi:hypothetical protein